jgi:hypothetical protein
VKEPYCFWSVANHSYAAMMQSAVDSARAVGVFKDFHVWTDRRIAGAVCHALPKLDKRGRLFPLHFLQQEVRKLNYHYYVWLDADTYFVRHPGNVLRVLQGAPVHASLESDAASPAHVQPDWQDCSLSNFTKLMRFNGVRSRGIFTVNGGFWIVHREAIDTFCRLAWGFWDFCKRAGYELDLEPLLSYATQMLCGNPYAHTLKATANLWAVDRKGCYAGALPDGRDWEYIDEFSGESLKINPAIVHAMHSKRALVARARGLAALGSRTRTAVSRGDGGL